MAKTIKIYSTSSCPRCTRAKELMKKWKIDYIEVLVDSSPKGMKEMQQRTDNARTVPQIFLGDRWLGGLDELTEAHMDGDLDEFIK